MLKLFVNHARIYFATVIVIGLSVIVGLALAYLAPAHACSMCGEGPSH